MALTVALLTGCSQGTLTSSVGLTGPEEQELRQLPASSKLYFRRSLIVPARSTRVPLPSPADHSGLHRELIINRSEVDRTIGPSTPLLVDAIVKPEPNATNTCGVTLALITPGGQTMQLRAAWRSRTRACAPITIAELSDLMIVVPYPPVPFH